MLWLWWCVDWLSFPGWPDWLHWTFRAFAVIAFCCCCFGFCAGQRDAESFLGCGGMMACLLFFAWGLSWVLRTIAMFWQDWTWWFRTIAMLLMFGVLLYKETIGRLDSDGTLVPRKWTHQVTSIIVLCVWLFVCRLTGLAGTQALGFYGMVMALTIYCQWEFENFRKAKVCENFRKAKDCAQVTTEIEDHSESNQDGQCPDGEESVRAEAAKESDEEGRGLLAKNTSTSQGTLLVVCAEQENQQKAQGTQTDAPQPAHTQDCPNKESKNPDACEGCGLPAGGAGIFLLKRVALYLLAGQALIAAWRQGKCFTKKEIYGHNRMTIRHPRVDDCDALNDGCRPNITSPKKLQYCEQYDGKYSIAPESQQKCTIKDGFEIFPPVFRNHFFIPTRLTTKSQRRNCEDEEDEASCFFETRTTDDNYIADIESFTLMVDHGFSVIRDSVAVGDHAHGPDAAGHRGFIVTGKTHSVQETLSNTIRGRRLADVKESIEQNLEYLDFLMANELEFFAIPGTHEARNESFPSARSTDWGDIISISDLLNMANISSLDTVSKLPDDDTNETGANTTMRWDGIELQLQIKYKNKGLWGPQIPQYFVYATKFPVNNCKHEYVKDTSIGSHETREIHIEHGICLEVVVTGEIYHFDLAAATVIAFLSVATVAFTQYNKLFEDHARPIMVKRLRRNQEKKLQEFLREQQEEKKRQLVPEKGRQEQEKLLQEQE